jgi:DNA-binding IclR family transcriptional regulator
MSTVPDHAKAPPTGTGALEKGLALLAHVSNAPAPCRFSDLLEQTGLPKATLHRMLKALLAHRYLAFDPREQTYGVGLLVFGMAQRLWEDMDIRRAAAPEIAWLNEKTGETVHLALLDETEVVYIDKVESQQRIRMFSAIGKRGPAYCTGVGKAMLAFLPEQRQRELVGRMSMRRFTKNTFVNRAAFLRHLAEIRARGYSKDLEEHEDQIRCTAAPIFDYRGEVIASLSVTAPSFRFTLKRLDEIAPLVVQAAGNTTRSLGGRPPAHLRG